jgi:hypothetical protein
MQLRYPDSEFPGASKSLSVGCGRKRPFSANPNLFFGGELFLPPNSAKIRGSSEHASKFILAPFEGPRQRLRLSFQACKSHSTTFEYVDITTRRVYWPWPRLWFPYPRHRYITLPCPTFQGADANLTTSFGALLPLRTRRGTYGLCQKASYAIDLLRYWHTNCPLHYRWLPFLAISPQRRLTCRVSGEYAALSCRQAFGSFVLSIMRYASFQGSGE